MSASKAAIVDPADRRSWIDPLLLTAVVVAAVLRLLALGSAPPGINQDEALSAWNGWCLLKTGHALSGEPWPIFHTRNLGDYPTMLFFYALMPFQALFGLSAWSTRLPVALAGIAAVVCAWDLGRRMFGERAGGWAALAMAIAPWGVFLGRFGTGAGLGPLQALLPLCCLARTGLVPALGEPGQRRAAWALAAGLAFGVGTYGFHSLRLQLPLTLAAVFLASPAAAWRSLADRGARPAWIALALGFLVPFVPLAYVSFADPQSLQRWQMTRLWPPGTPLPTILGLMGERWLLHFGPDFLFFRGDHYRVLNPTGWGALAWWSGPPLVIGIAVLLVRAAADARARILLLLVLLYPVGDLVSANEGVHSLRSAAGLPALALAIGLGAQRALEWLARRRRQLARAAAAALLFVAVVEAAYVGNRFVRVAPRDRTLQIEYQVALLQAGHWLASRVGPEDHVFCTTTGMNQPFVILLVALRYDPARWLADPKDRVEDSFDRYRAFGRFHFIYDPSAQAAATALEANGKPDKVWFLVRPNELGLRDPVLRLRSPSGEEMLWVCEQSL